MASTQTAHRPKGERVSPVHTLELVKALGTTRAADALGVSTSLLHAARRQKRVSRVVEIAAEGRLRSPVDNKTETMREVEAREPLHLTKPTAKSNGHVLILLDVPVDRRVIVEQVAKAIGAEFLADAAA